MKFYIAALLTAALAFVGRNAEAQSATSIVVTSCGAQTLSVGKLTPLFVDATGKLCDSGLSGSVNISQIGGVNIALGQTTMSASLPVVIASNQSGLPVTGTFFQATQPVSAASLPLPSGAATSALQTTGNTSLTSIITALGSPFQVGGLIGNTGFNVTGTLPAYAATPTFNLGTLNGAALDASVLGLQINQASSTSGQKGALSFGAVTTGAPSYTSGQSSPLSISTTGGLRVDGSASTQPVSGTVTANQGGSPWANNITQFGGTNLSTGTGVSGSGIPRVTVSSDSTVNVGGTLPGYAATPTFNLGTLNGAATAAKQPALGVAGTASVDVLTVQGIAGMTALKVDGSAVTQPVSAASLPLPSGAASATNQTGGGQKTQIVDGSGNVIASTSNNLNVQCANCSGSGVSTADGASYTAGVSLFASGGGFFQTTATNNPLTTGQQGLFQVTANRAIFSNLRNAAGTEVGTSTTPLQVTLANTGANATAVKVDGSASTQPVSGTVTANQGGAPWANNTTQFGGTNLSTGTGTGGAGIPRVTVSSDSSVSVTGTLPAFAAIPSVKIDQTTPGTTNGVQVNAALPAGTNLIGKSGFDTTTDGTTNGVVIRPTATAGAGIAPGVAGSASASKILKASAGNFYSAYVVPTVDGYLMIFNSATDPADGATTAGVASGNMQDCVKAPANVTTSISYAGGPPEVFVTAITAVFSSTGCSTKTDSANAFIHGSVQ